MKRASGAWQIGRSGVVVLLVLVTARRTAADDWPRWRGPQQNGISSEAEWSHEWPRQGPPVVWRADVGTGFSSMAVSGGRLVTMGNRDNTDTVYCLDAASGQLLWKHAYPCPLDDRFFEGGPTSTPTIDGDRVYTLSRQGHLFCFELATGRIVWSVDVHERTGIRIPGWGFAGSPVVHEDLLLLNVGSHGVALRKDSGQLVWQSEDAEAGYNTPVLVRRQGRVCAVLASGKYFHAVDVRTGQVVWQLRWLTRFGCNAADAIVRGDQVFISSGYNRGCALLRWSEPQPEVLWQNKAMQNQFGTSVLLDGYLYGIDGDTTGQRLLKCMEWSSGRVMWSAEGIGSGSLIAAGGRLVLLSEMGELIVARPSPERFEPLARAVVLSGKCWTPPVLANGRIYCRAAAGDLVCLDVRPRAAGDHGAAGHERSGPGIVGVETRGAESETR